MSEVRDMAGFSKPGYIGPDREPPKGIEVAPLMASLEELIPLIQNARADKPGEDVESTKQSLVAAIQTLINFLRNDSVKVSDKENFLGFVANGYGQIESLITRIKQAINSNSEGHQFVLSITQIQGELDALLDSFTRLDS